MKLTNLTKGLIAATALTVASFGANAGVIASSTLEVSKFTVLFDVNGNGDFTDDNPLDFPIVIISGERDGAASASFNGDSSQSNPTAGNAVATIDASLSCAGPDCAGQGLVENGIFSNNTNFADWTDDANYAFADMSVSGNAFDANGATGFTQAEAAIYAGYSSAGEGSATIDNNLFSQINIQANTSMNAMIIINYVAELTVALSDDVMTNDNVFGKASASYGFDVSLDNSQVFSESKAFSTLDNSNFVGTVLQKNEYINSGILASAPISISAGFHTITIDQTSEVDVSLVPEPTSIALFGLGLIGLAGMARRRNS